MTRALYGGSFDPIHLGHLSVIERAATIFDAVVVAVLANPDKPSGIFTRTERARLVAEATAHLSNVSVHEGYGLTVDVAASVGADVLVRTGHKELHHERTMAATNETLTGIQTFLVTADPVTETISSTEVRHLAGRARFDVLSTMVPPVVLEALGLRSRADTA